MVRLIAFLVGLFMAGWLLVSAGVTTYEMISDPAKPTIEAKYYKHAKEVSFAHEGPLGKYDNRQLQRGFKVYTEVCSSCHSLHQIAFRNLEDIGYSEPEVKAIAKGWATKQPTFDTVTGDRAERDNLPADKIPMIYYAGQGHPPDLSLITKARHDGPAYVYSLLTGYNKPVPKDVTVPDGLNYNPYFANLNIAMAAPLAADGQVTFDDGSKNDIKSMAKDVSAFLTWTAEPKMNQRKTAGWAALIFLLIFTGLTYLSYRQIWAGKK